MVDPVLICPVCGAPLDLTDAQARCASGHSFDRAKEGYFNLLRSHKQGDRMGDDKQAARYRRDFLNRGYYACLQNALTGLFAGKQGTLLDICCGEGYYTSALGALPGLRVYGFDLAKEMVRLAAKRGGGTYFVANLAHLPVAESSFDWAVHLFAPFQEAAFCRLLKPGGRLITVVPGPDHLFGLKKAVYDRPYRNDGALPKTAQLRQVETMTVRDEIDLASQQDIQAVFRMTPYYYRTGPQDRAKLTPLDHLATPIEFILGVYEKPARSGA